VGGSFLRVGGESSEERIEGGGSIRDWAGELKSPRSCAG
jgi:hypothetical protein